MQGFFFDGLAIVFSSVSKGDKINVLIYSLEQPCQMALCYVHVLNPIYSLSSPKDPLVRTNKWP